MPVIDSNLSVKLINSIGKLLKLSAKPAGSDGGATCKPSSFGSSSESSFTRKSPSTGPDPVRVEDLPVSGVETSELDPSGNISCERHTDIPETGGSKREKDLATCKDVDCCESLPKPGRGLDPIKTGSI